MVNSLENIDKSKVSASRIEGLSEVIESEIPNIITGAASTIVTSDLTANKILVSDSNGKVSAGSKSDSDYIHTSGNETKTGTLTLSNSSFINKSTTDYSEATSNTSNRLLQSYDKNDVSLSSIYSYRTISQTEGKSSTALWLRGFNLTNSSSYADLRNSITDDGEATLDYYTRNATNTNITTETNSTSSNKIATFGWVNNPATSTNVVHRTGNETIDGTKTFSKEVIQRSNNAHFSANDTNVTKGTNPSTTNTSAIFRRNDTNGAGLASVYNRIGTTGNNFLGLVAYEFNGSSNAQMGIHYDNDGYTYATCPTPKISSNNTEIPTTEWVNKVDRNCVEVLQPTLSDTTEYGTFVVIKFPDGHNMLCDCGYKYQTNEIDSFLAGQNITHFDIVMITHFHTDHCGCATHIINHYCDKNTLFYKCMDCDCTQFTTDESDYIENENTYKTALSNKNYTYIIPTDSEEISLFNGTISLTFYNTDTSKLQEYYTDASMAENTNGTTNANNVSMCCLIKAFNTSIFISGDIEYLAQKNISTHIPCNVDIMQLPHHGVNLNGYLSFYDNLNPNVVFFNRNIEFNDMIFKYWWRWLLYHNSNKPTFTNMNTTYLSLKDYIGNIIKLRGKTLLNNREINQYHIREIFPTVYDFDHNARLFASWTIEDVVNMCNHHPIEMVRLGSTHDTTTLISEINSIMNSTSWIIEPYTDVIKIYNHTNFGARPIFAYSRTNYVQGY